VRGCFNKKEVITMGKCGEKTKGTPEVEQPAKKETKGSCGCGCTSSEKEGEVRV